MMTYSTLYTDGSCNNITRSGIGMGICIRHGKGVEQDYYVYLPSFEGKATSNIAEFLALINGLTLCREQGVKNLRIFCDSQVLVRGVTKEYDIKEPTLLGLMGIIDELLTHFSYTIQWVPRYLNKEADKLSKLAVKCQPSILGTPPPTPR